MKKATKVLLRDTLNNIQAAANHIHGEWQGGYIRFTELSDQKKHAKKNYERLCKLVQYAQELIDT